MRNWFFRHRRRSVRLANGFSLVEVVVCVVLVGILMIAALETVGAAFRRQAGTLDLVLGEQLARDLMNEVLRQDFQDSASGPVLGPEPGEITIPPSRARFNDVDDYLDWAESPPADKNGTPLVGFDGWARRVTVQWADPGTLAPTTAINTGIKKITVAALHRDEIIASLVGYRSIAWADTLPAPDDPTGNHPPVAVATGSHLSGSRQTTAALDASASNDPDQDPLSYTWSFGDGAAGSSAVVTHLYTAVGTYTATVTVYDGRGGVARASLTVTVTP